MRARPKAGRGRDQRRAGGVIRGRRGRNRVRARRSKGASVAGATMRGGRHAGGGQVGWATTRGGLRKGGSQVG